MMVEAARRKDPHSTADHNIAIRAAIREARDKYESLKAAASKAGEAP
jgi:hypothetical protein